MKKTDLKKRQGCEIFVSSDLLAQYKSILLQTMKALAMPHKNLSCVNDLPKIAESIFEDYMKLIDQTSLQVIADPPLINMTIKDLTIEFKDGVIPKNFGGCL